jgi:hypothetical protein
MVLTQADIEKYLATSDEFWKTFDSSLQANYSYWHNACKNLDYEAMLKYFKEFEKYFDFFFQFPVLKKEFIVKITKQDDDIFILTNFRLLMKQKEIGVVSIPLKKIISYCENDSGIIQYEKNDKVINLKLSYFMGRNDISAQIDRSADEEIDETMYYLISKSIFDISQSFSNLSLPKLAFPEVKNQITLKDNSTKNQNVSKQMDTNNANGVGSKRIIIASKIIIAIFLILSLYTIPAVTGWTRILVLVICFFGWTGIYAMKGEEYSHLARLIIGGIFSGILLIFVISHLKSESIFTPDKNGVVNLVSKLEFESFNLTSKEISKRIWHFCKKAPDAEKIIVTFVIKGNDIHGNYLEQKFTPYEIEKAQINEICKFEEDYYVYGYSGAGTMILMQNGYFE